MEKNEVDKQLVRTEALFFVFCLESVYGFLVK